MSFNQLIFRNMKKNLANYYLYVFALIFSVALYFSFVTLQYDPSMDEATGTVRGAAALRASSILLVSIVAVFLVYANKLFIKRRSKEIGLLQLIGMTKQRIFYMLSAENLILYFGSLVIGIALGFSISKLMTMIVFKITGVEDVASLNFSTEALVQTLLVFGGVYVLIMLLNYVFIKRQTILSLFHVKQTTESRVKKLSIMEIVMGVLGMGLIVTGYYVSSKLFDGDFVSINSLFAAMIFILASVIIGTYFFYKGSVRFISNVIRKNKGGYLNVNEVLSLSSIMFRMKSNALLLTIITTVSALAIGLLSLSYISYYSAEKTAEGQSPDDFTFISAEDADEFGEALSEQGIEYSKQTTELVRANVYIEDIVGAAMEDLNFDGSWTTMAIVSDESVEEIDVSEKETQFAGYNDAMNQLMKLADSGEIKIKNGDEEIDQKYTGISKIDVLPSIFTYGLPTAIVDDSVFKRIESQADPELQGRSNLFVGLTLEEGASIEEADELFQSTELSEQAGNDSQYASTQFQKQNMGLIMFIVGFLGLTFLITSGCILYFKQMDEGDEEQPNYTILRKLGYTRHDLVKGIQIKQLFNFGIPLIIGLIHSYFAVQSGWFFFGTEIWTPMFIVMGVYTALYSIFGILSVLYYKKVIREAL
ncbi:bacitracin export permease protein BceB [Halobacillus andaensis]|uniref:Bacitracin export permease protein BceB n=1 Tax=Halobacillus andaensis TaxID=1176239 RepID=A0A917EWX6_HALAA|nr:ABC transporter permease [Halobacillus andaensis]MBP2004862.1 bacitracin transport system permease protein [Halobacillus andaensis]GGF18332.1 bacitracin export permease protein BceB [Halobacillus andaensis]